jgi:hypothetical protein
MTLPTKVPPQLEIDDELRRFMQDQVEGQLVKSSRASHTFVAADTAERVRHRLPGKPEGFKVVDIDAAAQVYRTSADIVATDKHWAWVRCDTAATSVVLEFF